MKVQELVKAWRLSGRKAQVLEGRLQQAVEVARRYRRDLLRLAEQNRTRKLQAESLQQKLLQLLEQRAPEPAPSELLSEVPEGDESVPAGYVRQLLSRLRESHSLLAEFETLLEFREKQVHELLASQAAPVGGDDWRVQTLQRELTDARHRIRLLTQELAQQKVQSGGQEALQARVNELEKQLAEVVASGDAALQGQLRHREEQIAQLNEQFQVRLEELKKAAVTIHTARDRIRQLESDLAAAQSAPPQEDQSDLVAELTALQDEIGRLQQENEQIPELHRQLAEARAESARQAGASADPTRMAKLEAALLDMRQKLELAGNKYKEVKAALIEKHQQLLELQNRSQESEKKGQFLEPLVRTLESALEDSRRQNTALQSQLESMKKAPPVAAVGGDSSEALASMENKLKEARRSAVRAQAEAGLKRKEMAKLQEEVEALRAKVLALGGTL